MIIDKYTTYYTNIKYQLMPACIAFLKLVPLSTSLPQSSKELNVICGGCPRDVSSSFKWMPALIGSSISVEGPLLF